MNRMQYATVMLRASAMIVLCCAVGACDTMQRAGSLVFGDSSQGGISGLEASLVPIAGSAATGSARFVARGESSTMLVQINGLPPGRFRILVHASGNCSSPNGFSAGPPWSPAGASAPLYDRLPILTPNTEGTGTLTVRLPGVLLRDLEGKSVVVHDSATGPFTAEPDVRNDRIACGVIGPLKTLL